MSNRKRKTPSNIKMRFQVTSTGKVLRRSQNMRHLRRKKSGGQVRQYKVAKEVTGKMAIKIRRLLGHKKPKS